MKKYIVKAILKKPKIIIQLIKANNETQAEEKFLFENQLFLDAVKKFITKEKK